MPTPLPDDESPLLALPGFRWLVVLLLFVIAMTLWLLLYPFDFESPRKSTWLMERGISGIHKINLAGNLLLFIPFGLLAGWVWSFVLPGRSGAIVLLVALDGAILSVIGETLQMWLPQRTSSLNDLMANTLSAGGGGLLGTMLAPMLTRHWMTAAAFLQRYSASRTALHVLFVVLFVRLVPFDYSLETYYLRTKFTQETKPAGGPFSATRRWLAGDAAQLPVAAQVKEKALRRAEWQRAASNFVLFAALACYLLRAAGQLRRTGAAGGTATWIALAACVVIVIGTELLQGALRSRVMDTTDPVAGMAGVALGAAVAWLIIASRSEPRESASGD